MKKVLITWLTFFSLQLFAQTDLDSLRTKLTSNDNESLKDIFNPINFTTITERMPKSNGNNKKYPYSLWAGMDYIQKGSTIHINFDQLFVDKLDSNLNLQVLAYIQRKDKSVKPLSIFGFTEVKTEFEKVENLKSGLAFKESNDNSNLDISYSYKIVPFDNSTKSYSGELNLAWEEVSEDDQIIIHITNTARNNSGFSFSLKYDDFGWKQGPTGGFSFVKIMESEFTEFTPSASLGYSFRYQPRKSSKFINHFFSPSFGPMLHVFQNNENTTIGFGGHISTFYNMLNFGVGGTINGVNHGKPYFFIGLNFVESFNNITSLVNR